MPPFWSHLDAILVINLPERTDKWEALQARLKHHVPSSLPILRIEGIWGKELPGFNQKPWFQARTAERASICAGAAGCTLSHRKAIAFAQEQGFSRVLILEDDALPARAESPALNQILETFFAQPLGKRLLYLGCHKRPKKARLLAEEDGESLWQISGALTTHAYIVEAPLFPLLLQELPSPETVWSWIARYKAIDQWYWDFLGQKAALFALYPNFIIQEEGQISDIGGLAVSHAKQKDALPKKDVGGLFPFYQKTGLQASCLLAGFKSQFRWIKARLWGFSPFKKKKSS